MQETRRPRIWTLAFLVAVAILVWGASAGAALAQGDPGPSEEDVTSELDLHFRDEVDAGDDPFHGGCHYHYGDKTCRSFRGFFSGDYCRQHILFEWTDSSCHEPSDDKRIYDCRDECAKREMVGTCVTLRDHCREKGDPDDEPRDSARCECRKKEGDERNPGP